MKSEFIAIVLSFLACICFFGVYFFHQEILNLALALTWLVIAIGNYRNFKKNRK